MANENQYYKYPFAENGNADEVPDQGSGGVVDYESGYGPDYEKAVGVADRKRIERTSFNGIVKGITKNIKQWQERNFPTWIEDDGSSDPAVPFSYAKGIIVSHNGVNWISIQEGNTDEPSESSPNWIVYNHVETTTTTLFSGAVASGNSASLSESIRNFHMISVVLGDNSEDSDVKTMPTDAISSGLVVTSYVFDAILGADSGETQATQFLFTDDTTIKSLRTIRDNQIQPNGNNNHMIRKVFGVTRL